MLDKNRQAILDEAARSVRRTFVGSIAGTLGMFAVVGAAGAYGMPDQITAQMISAAMAKLNLKQPASTEQATKLDRVVKTIDADDALPAPKIVVADAAIRIVPPGTFTDVRPVAPPAPPAPRIAPPAADAMARADVAVVPAALVFEAPKLDDIKPLAPMPEIETLAAVEPPKAAEVTEPPKAGEAAAWPSPGEQPAVTATIPAVPAELPQFAFLPMPLARPALTPAQRLNLSGKDYDKAQRCLATAIYFEARNEPARGQMAVAQVVLNRVFSPHYPKDVCSVVYQNAHRHLACQFTFACDGKPDRITERGPWERANRISREALDAKIWLPEVNKATHYHAAYVRPNWIREMKMMARHGLHTFYRPRNWGDGSDEANWATTANSAKPESAAKQAATAATQKKVPLRQVYARQART